MISILFLSLGFFDPVSQCTYSDSTMKVLVSVPIGKRSLTIPDTVISIIDGSAESTGAFYECRNDIEIVIFNQHITKIGQYAFQFCSKIKELVFPPSVTHLEVKSLSYMTSLTSVILQEGSKLESIGQNTFLYDINLETIIIQKNGNLKSIDVAAFEMCVCLKSFEIPDSVTFCGHHLFTYCTSLETVTITSNPQFTIIPYNFFYMCESLKNVTLGKYVEKVESESFSGCTSLLRIIVSTENSNFVADNDENSENFGVLLKNDISGKILSVFPPGKLNTKYVIPEGIVTISAIAFNSCNNLKEIVLAKTVSVIEEYAFTKSVNIEKYTVPEGNNNFLFENSMLYNFGKSAIYAMAPKHSQPVQNLVIPRTVSTISASAFNFCDNLISVGYESNPKITNFGNSLFYFCQNLKEINIPPTVQLIGWYCFQNDTCLEKVSFSSSDSKLTTICGAAFENCVSLLEISFPNSVTTLNNQIFRGCAKLHIVSLPDSISSMDFDNFDGCTSLESLRLPSNLVEIPKGTFKNCQKLKKVVFPINLISIQANAFDGCSQYVPKLPKTVELISSNAFQNCVSIVTFDLPEKLKSLEVEVFNGCSNLEIVRIPKDVIEIKNTAFFYCDKLEKFELIEYENGVKNENFMVIDGVLYNKIGDSLLNYPPGKKMETFVVPDKVTTVGFVAFYGARKVDSVILTNVKNVYYNAFGKTNFKCGGVIFDETKVSKETLIREGVKEEMIERCPPTAMFSIGMNMLNMFRNQMIRAGIFLMILLEN